MLPHLAAGAVLGVVSIVTFAVAWLVDVPVFSDPSSVLSVGGAMAGTIGVALLVADVVTPVPSSLVMVAHGALFGAVLGGALSLLGRTGAAVLGAALGRGGARWRRLAPPSGRGHQLLHRWGPLAVVISRPVPVLSESVAVAAGSAGMPWSRFLVAAILGALPEAILYALAGAVAASFGNAALTFVLLAVLAGVAWFALGRQDERGR